MLKLSTDVVEKAVEVTYEIAKPHQNPYNYLYHNPGRIFTLQWFSHWTQNYQNHLLYKLMEKICEITGHLAIPQVLLNKHVAKYKDKKVRISKNVFYILGKDEISSTIKEKYNHYRHLLDQEINKG